MKRVVLILAATVALALLTGCALRAGGDASAGAGTVYYIEGELKDTEPHSLEQTHLAAKSALEDLKYVVINDIVDATGAKIQARMASDAKVTIALKALSPTHTEIRIRVGTFGDEQLSRLILDKLKARQ